METDGWKFDELCEEYWELKLFKDVLWLLKPLLKGFLIYFLNISKFLREFGFLNDFQPSNFQKKLKYRRPNWHYMMQHIINLQNSIKTSFRPPISSKKARRSLIEFEVIVTSHQRIHFTADPLSKIYHFISFAIFNGK